jgi:tetratricopeptide (TPR) repeat protein
MPDAQAALTPLGAAVPATRAQIDRQVALCASTKPEKDRRDQQISACTAAIEFGKFTGQDLAHAFRDRVIGYRMKSDNDHAMQDYDQAIKVTPNDARLFVYRADMYFREHDYDRSIADNTEAIRLDPNNDDAQRSRAKAYAEKGQYDRAIADYSEAIRRQPKYFWLFVGRALVYFKLGQFDDAIADFDAALKLAPNKLDSIVATILYGRGVAKQKKGDNADGNADIAAAKTIDPDIAKIE